MHQKIIIDGYNLLHCGLAEINPRGDLESRRESLIRIVEHYAVRGNRQIHIVFDSRERHPRAANRGKHMRVTFSQPGKEADEVIRQIVRKERNTRKLLIVSSDREVTNAASDHGAQTISSQEFAQQLKSTSSPGEPPPAANRAKYEDEELSASEVDFWLKMFRKDNGDE